MRSGGRASAADVRRALAVALAADRLRIVAALIRTTRDWDLAEDAVSDAAERALLRWPGEGIPANPAAWLTTTAVRRAIDVIRRAGAERSKQAELERMGTGPGMTEEEGAAVAEPTDDRLRLLFTCCHPALPMEARVALTLKVVAGLPTAAVARAFLTTEATMGQRLLRAKQKIANAAIPYRVPTAEMLPDRLDGVLAVIYLVYTEGYATTADEPAAEAIRLGRLLVELMPGSPEVRGLLALMLLQQSRRDARVVDGVLVTLEQQDRSRWDAALIDEALGLLDVAPGECGAGARGRYAIQAALAAAHARAPDAARTDWRAIVTLYDELFAVLPSPVVALNRAIAVGMCDGPLAGLMALDDIAGDRALAGFHLVPAARADLLARADRRAEAVESLDRAIELAPTEQERLALTRRRAELR